MKTLLAILFPVCFLLAGCPTMSMTPEQLKASEGIATCGTGSNPWGRVSIITAAADNVRKGATGDSVTVIKCGDASMEVTNKVGVPLPAAKPAP